MIIEFFVTIVTNLLTSALSAAQVLTIPSDIAGALSTFMAYGNYVVGGDLLLLFATSVTTWMTLKLTVGVVLFVWRLLPLT